MAPTLVSKYNNSHLDALELRLSHERSRLANAKTAGERELRSVWIAQIEKEIGAELPEISDDELLAELS
jgi:hypothetical protein